MALSSSDKALLGGALLLALGSAAVFSVMIARQIASPPPPIPRVELADVPYAPVATAAAAVRTEVWAVPGAQSRGREWIYDTFTPPEIFYQARTRQFTVRPPSSLVEEEVIEPFGLELISVRPELFRLQLIGYVGAEGAWQGTFQNVDSGEAFIAASGQRVPKLGLTIKTVDVGMQAIALPESMTTQQRVASAVIIDEKTGREVVLTHRERNFTGTISALVAGPLLPAPRDVREGEEFTVSGISYRMGKIQLSPPSAEVIKTVPGRAQTERRVLVPEEAERDEGADQATAVSGVNL